MARSFSSSDVARITQSINDVRARGDEIAYAKQRYHYDIQRYINDIIDRQTYIQLQDIPVSELNKDKSGIRVSALTSAGYNTVASLVGLSPYRITAIKGIGDEKAWLITNKVNEIYYRIRREQKIKISADHRNRENAALLKAIYCFNGIDPLLKNSEYIVRKYHTDISYALSDLSAGSNSLKWIFSSSVSKQRAEGAYTYLSQILASEYGRGMYDIYQQYRQLEATYINVVWDDFIADNIAYINTIESICPGVLGNDDKYFGLPEELAVQVQEQGFFPEGLLCTLRNYQEWGVKYILRQGRVLLGDEMGLGKTIQAIATMVSLRNTGATHFLVVCPASVLSNWCREIKKMSTLFVTEIYGPNRVGLYQLWEQKGGVGVTTYETTEHIANIDDFGFDMCIVDEAHYIKNPDAQRTQNVKMLCAKSDKLLFMTGTALENKVEEMTSLIGILNPEVYNQIKDIHYILRAPQFRQIIAPVYYRRKREDVLSELPDKIEKVAWCKMNSYEEMMYESAVLNKDYTQARRVSWNVENLEQSSKANRLVELVKQAEAEDRKVIVFSFFLDTIAAVCEVLRDRCVQPINGSISPEARQRIVDDFDTKGPGAVLPAQIMAGGTGLNIQSASVVIMCEPQFKPSIENQAISRAYRMGQSRNVLVYRLICEDTVDEKIMDILADKQQVFDAFADTSVAAETFGDGEINDTTFGQIIEEEIERINNKN